MEDGFVAQFECAICQGVNESEEFCVLGCGHPYHVSCVEQWLEHSATPTCPTCRAKVNRRSTRVLLGVGSVPNVQGSATNDRLLVDKQQQVLTLQGILDAKQQEVDSLLSLVTKLTSKQEKMQQALTDSTARLSAFEASRQDDMQRISALTKEKQKLQERYKTDMLQLQSQLRDEERRVRRAEGDVRRMQLINPHLTDSAAIQQLAGLYEAEGQLQGQQQSAAALAVALAQRNKELKDAQRQVQLLHAQQQQQQAAADRDAEAERSRHTANLGRIEKEKELHMKDALRLEYENVKLKTQVKHHLQELQELKSVLIVLQGDHAAPLTLPSRHPLHANQPAEGGSQQSAMLPDDSSATGWQQQCHERRDPSRKQQFKSKELKSHKQQEETTSCSLLGRVASQPLKHSVQVVEEFVSLDSNSIFCDDEMHFDQPANQADILRGHGRGDMLQKHSKQQDNMTRPGEVLRQGKENGADYTAAEAVPGVHSLLIAGSTLLRPSASADAIPSFLTKAKLQPVMSKKAAGGTTVIGQLMRQGPDGRGSTTRHLAARLKRINVEGPLPAPKKPLTSRQTKCNNTEASKGIAEYFCK